MKNCQDMDFHGFVKVPVLVRFGVECWSKIAETLRLIQYPTMGINIIS